MSMATKKFTRFVSSGLLAFPCLWLPNAAQAQTDSGAGSEVNRPAGPNQHLGRVAGSMSPRVSTAEDMGRVSGSESITGVTILLKQTRSQSEELQRLLIEQQHIGGPNYHKWLTTEEYATRFGCEGSTIDLIEEWLRAQGGSHLALNESHTALSFDMNAGQLEQAFSTEIHRYRVGEQSAMANTSDLEVPPAIAPFVDGVVHLDEFRPTPQLVLGRASHSHAELTTAFGRHFTTPADIKAIYDVVSLSSKGVTGQGQHIAVVGQSAIRLEDVERFRAAAGLKMQDPTLLLVPNTGSSVRREGDEIESDIDLEYSGAMAPDAEVTLVYTGSDRNYNSFDALSYAVDQNIAPIISVSYSECEAELSRSNLTRIETVLIQANAQGQTVLAASGDSGATGCETAASLTAASATSGLAVHYPASSQYVTSVGGTMFEGGDSYWAPSSGQDGESARSYIPERAWNETTASAGAGLLGTGGGVSLLFPKPQWQTGLGVPSDNARDVPDIALDAGVYDSGYIFCSSDPATGLQGSCSHGFLDSTASELTVGGGTSFGTPIAAGVVALILQNADVGRLGNMNPILYSLAAVQDVFHDITAGGNQQACSAGSKDCPDGGLIGYSAAPGYDQTTGLGTPDASRLANAIAELLQKPARAIVLTLRESTSASETGEPDQVIAAVNDPESNSGGAIQFYLNGHPSGAPAPVRDGGAEYQLLGSAGTYTISAVYTSSVGGLTATASIVVTIRANQNSAFGVFTLQGIKNAPAGSGELDWTMTVTPTGMYSGQVSFNATTTDSDLIQSGCYSLQDVVIQSGQPKSTVLRVGRSQAVCGHLSSMPGVSLHRFSAAKETAMRKAGAEGTAPSQLGLMCGIAQACGITLLGGVRRRAKFMASSSISLLSLVTFCAGCSLNPTAVQTTSSTQILFVTGTDVRYPSIASSAALSLE